MNTPGKWLTRAGALLVLLGFVLPVMTVSCSGLPEAAQPYSLMTLAASSNYNSGQPLFYLTPLAILATLVFSFLPVADTERAKQYLFAQAGGVVLSLLGLILGMMPLYQQLGQYSQIGIQINPQYGAFVLIVGFILCVVGLVMQWTEKSPPERVPYVAASYDQAYNAPPNALPPAPQFQVSQQQYGAMAQSGCYLEMVQGQQVGLTFPLTRDNLLVGRGSNCDLQVFDPKVSRQHLCLRYAQGYWFCQDQNSGTGTHVNGVQLQATRLNPGDNITIGDTTFIFRS